MENKTSQTFPAIPIGVEEEIIIETIPNQE